MGIYNSKALWIMGLIMVLALSFFFSGCKEPTIKTPDVPLFNSTLNTEIEELTNISNVPEAKEFNLSAHQASDAKYELTRDDLFSLSGGNFTSQEISVLGLKLGDSEQMVLESLGIPDVTFIANDKSYKNMEYGKKIGINNSITAISYHIENKSVTQISIRKPFNIYLHGNTTLGQTKESIYALLGISDYQDFVANHRVFYYVEKGVEFYINRDNVQIISLVNPKVFRGVEYVTVLEDLGAGIMGNVTRPILIEDDE